MGFIELYSSFSLSLIWEGTCVGFSDDFFIFATSSAENYSMCVFYPKPTYLSLASFFLTPCMLRISNYTKIPVPGDLGQFLPDPV
jgi:hypothetical protein